MPRVLPEGNVLSTVKTEAARAKPLTVVASWQHHGVDSFGKTLRGFMTAHKMSQSELARRLRVKPSAVNRWLKDEREPSAQDLLAAAVVFHLTPYELYAANYKEPEPKGEPIKLGRPAKSIVVEAEPSGLEAAAEGPPQKTAGAKRAALVPQPKRTDKTRRQAE